MNIDREKGLIQGQERTVTKANNLKTTVGTPKTLSMTENKITSLIGVKAKAQQAKNGQLMTLLNHKIAKIIGQTEAKAKGVTKTPDGVVTGPTTDLIGIKALTEMITGLP